MKIFLDTNIIFKLYYKELESDELTKFIDSNDIVEIFISHLAILEFASTVWKKSRMNLISIDEAKLFLSIFINDIPKFSIITISNILLNQSLFYLSKYGYQGLRTLDSIQLAAAISVKSDCNFFLTSDKLLQTFFLNEGLEVKT